MSVSSSVSATALKPKSLLLSMKKSSLSMLSWSESSCHWHLSSKTLDWVRKICQSKFKRPLESQKCFLELLCSTMNKNYSIFICNQPILQRLSSYWFLLDNFVKPHSLLQGVRCQTVLQILLSLHFVFNLFLSILIFCQLLSIL